MFIAFYRKYERWFSIGAFLVGFVIDSITLTRIDLWLDNLILASYLFLAGFGIFLFHFLRRKPSKSIIRRRAILFLPLFIQFAFGGLFSGYLVFYSRSASLVTSWIFVLLIIGLLVANEFFKQRYARLEFQIAIYYTTIFSFAIFYVPILVKSIGTGVFLLSGLVSLAAIWLFVRLLSFAIPKRIAKNSRTLKRVIVVIYLSFNVLYFTNVIPPIPLSMKEAGVYHLVERQGDAYIAVTEESPWYALDEKFSPRIHITEGEPVYVFTSVFAPTDLETVIFHKWQYYDQAQEAWIETDQFNYPIRGGRDGGYRGYTTKEQVTPGLWRVDIVTPQDQIIGRVSFEVIYGYDGVELETVRF